MFCFVDDISSKIEVFPVSEIWGPHFHAKQQFHAHLSGVTPNHGIAKPLA
jgi:hypothetical protein